jgi:hypothetical protein
VNWGRYGDENKLADFFGIVMGLINFVCNRNDALRYFKAGIAHLPSLK